MSGEAEVVEAMADLWPELTDGLTANHCILSARVAVEVGRYFGVEFVDRCVEAMLFNAEGYRLACEGVPVSEWPDDAWSLGVAHGTKGPGYDGHVIVESSRYLLDLAAGQFDRPQRGLPVSNTMMLEKPDTDSLLARGEDVWIGRDDGAVMLYRPSPRTDYRLAPDWRIKANWRVESAALIRLMRDAGVG